MAKKFTQLARKRFLTWYEHVKQWETLGCSQREYCQKENLTIQSFSRWVKRIRNPHRRWEIELLGRLKRGEPIIPEEEVDVIQMVQLTLPPPQSENRVWGSVGIHGQPIKVILGDIALEIPDDFDSETLSRVITTIRSCS